MNVTSQMPVNDTAETKTSGQWPFMGAMKKFSLLSKIRGWGWWQRAQPCWQGSLWAVKFQRFTEAGHYSQPPTSLLGSSSQFLLCWYLRGARDSSHSPSLPQPSCYSTSAYCPFNRVSVIRSHWITSFLQTFAKHPPHRSVVYIEKAIHSNLCPFLLFDSGHVTHLGDNTIST